MPKHARDDLRLLGKARSDTTARRTAGMPKRGAPPFETVVFFPGSNAFRTRAIEDFPTGNIEFLVKSGRAVAFPEYKASSVAQPKCRTARPPDRGLP